MRRFLLLTAAVAVLVHPARADEVEQAIEAALEAYRAGDIRVATEELDFAATLLRQRKAANLADFLPEALEGWTRSDQGSQSMPAAMFGGGMMAGAVYAQGDQRVEVQIMADNQMVASMAALFSNPAMMGAVGTVKRINRQRAIVTNEGEVQTLIANRILVMVTGSAPVAAKEAYFGAVDFRGLEGF